MVVSLVDFQLRSESLKSDLKKILHDNPSELFSSIELASKYNLEHEQLSAAIRSLDFKDGFLILNINKRFEHSITDAGNLIVANNDPGFNLYHKLPSGKNVEKKSFLAENGFSDQDFNSAMKNKWIKIQKDSNKNIYIERVENANLETPIKNMLTRFLNNNNTLDDNDINYLSKHKLIVSKKVTDFQFKRGPNFTLEDVEEKLELTLEDLIDQKWKNFTFRKYNLESLGTQASFGALHPLLKMKEEISIILTQMGFNEMPTNQYVENSFWNFDALLVQQNHPARDEQDTFFIQNCGNRNDIPDDLFKNVSETHKKLFGTECNYQESQKKVLRTHTTAVSARILSKFAAMYSNDKGQKNAKYFSIDKVFRNETLDATHLAEFHQIEGWIANENLTLADLMGTLKEFYVHLGIDQIKFKSTFNPYTEPSLEVHGYHKEMKKWIEIANSGIFRPEMLKALNIDPKIRVIAWGLSLERPTMIKYGIKNIRELYGNKVDLDMVQNSGICILD